MRLESYCNYFIISTLPPAVSIATFAFSLIAFTLKESLAFNSPVAKIFTLSVRLINPLIYKFSAENSTNAYFSCS